MGKLYIRVSDTRLWIMYYNFVCAVIFIPLTTYGSLKLRKRRIARENIKRLQDLEKLYKKLKRTQDLEKLYKLYRILKLAGSVHSSNVLFQILTLRSGGDFFVDPEIEDCISLNQPAYVDEERIIRFLNDKYSRLAIKGIIYITKEALCWLVSNHGVVDFPVVFFERIKLDAFYGALKTSSEWGVWSIALLAVSGGFISPLSGFVYASMIWNHIHNLKLFVPHVKKINLLTEEIAPRTGARKDVVVFDAQNGELPPVIENSKKLVQINTLDEIYEIREDRIVDVSKVSKLKIRFSDRRIRRVKKAVKAKMVSFSDKVREWNALSGSNTNDDDLSDRIDRLIKDGII